MIGITLGDPAGIGTEVALKALAGQTVRVLFIGSISNLTRTACRLKLELPRHAEFLDTGPVGAFRFGAVQKTCGVSARAALEAGVAMLKQGVISGLVTAPVSKEALRLAGFAFPGQTEFLAARLGTRQHAMMAYVAATLRIVFVTIHVPLKQVPALITARRVAEKVRLLDDFLHRRERIRHPRIAVLALNPHAWEFTAGEEAKIARGIRLARVAGAEGPFPADSIGSLLERYDGIVAMYHDQAMIPAKLLGRDWGVNVTLGLPFVRTSPLHGTAFDIAGRGQADSGSMQAAIRLCQRLSSPGGRP